MQHYLVNDNVVTHRLPKDHPFEVRHRNKWGATVTTRHFSEAEAGVEKRWRCAHGYLAAIRDVRGEVEDGG